MQHLFTLATATALLLLLGCGDTGTSATLVASAGGKIQHPEFRFSDPPVVESSRRRQ
jgi:hypothetical protein